MGINNGLGLLSKAIAQASKPAIPVYYEWATVTDALDPPVVVLDTDLTATPRPVSENGVGYVEVGWRVLIKFQEQRSTIMACPQQSAYMIQQYGLVDDRLTATESTVSSMSGVVGAHSTTLGIHAQSLSSLDGRITSNANSITSHTNTLNNLGPRVTTIEGKYRAAAAGTASISLSGTTVTQAVTLPANRFTAAPSVTVNLSNLQYSCRADLNSATSFRIIIWSGTTMTGTASVQWIAVQP